MRKKICLLALLVSTLMAPLTVGAEEVAGPSSWYTYGFIDEHIGSTTYRGIFQDNRFQAFDFAYEDNVTRQKVESLSGTRTSTAGGDFSLAYSNFTPSTPGYTGPWNLVDGNWMIHPQFVATRWNSQNFSPGSTGRATRTRHYRLTPDVTRVRIGGTSILTPTATNRDIRVYTEMEASANSTGYITSGVKQSIEMIGGTGTYNTNWNFWGGQGESGEPGNKASRRFEIEYSATTTYHAPRVNGSLPSPSTGSNNYTASITMSNLSYGVSSTVITNPWTWRTGSTNQAMSTSHSPSTDARRLTLSTPTNQPTNNGSTYTQIGQWTNFSVTGTDGHGERTTATAPRFNITTSTQFPLTIVYGSGAVNTSGGSIVNSTYSGSGTQPCGGESGWTRFPLTFTAGNTSTTMWTGTRYTRRLTVNGSQTTTTSGTAVRSNYSTNTSSSGHTVTAEAFGADGTSLSGRSTRTFYIDTVAPTANGSYNVNTGVFTDNSQDALSGISTSSTNRTKYAVTTSTATPANSEYRNHNVTYIPTTPGTYYVHVWATDLAGNTHRTRLGTTVTVAPTWYATPDLFIEYVSGTTNPSGTDIGLNPYSSTNSSANNDGGEEGWTNKALRIRVVPTVSGTFRTVLDINGSRTVNSSGGTATIANYTTNTTAAQATSGTPVFGVLEQTISPFAEVSSRRNSNIKMDRVAPTAQATYNSSTRTFSTSGSADNTGGSQLSTTRPVRVALMSTTATPADSAYYAPSAVPPPAPGSYYLWAWATDKAGNETKTRMSSMITVTALAAPTLEIVYVSGTTNPAGSNIGLNPYSSTNSPVNNDGGEDGWTNKALRIRVVPTITGTFHTILSVNGTQTVNTSGGTATIANYTTNTTVAQATSGTPVYGALAQATSPFAEISARDNKNIKMDRTAPIADGSYDVDTGTFTDASDDALSGISTSAQNKTKYALTTTTATPPDSEYNNHDVAYKPAPGTYWVHVWATDRAGNMHRIRLSSQVTISALAAPNVTIDYVAGTTNPAGINIGGNVYSSTNSTANNDGGEDGWTNKALRIRVMPTVVGTFHTILSVNGTQTVNTSGGTVTIASYTTNTTVAQATSGTPLFGVLAQTTSPFAEISARDNKNIKMDRTAPIADGSYDVDTGTFTDASDDALSGISTSAQNKTKYALTTTTATPPDSAYVNHDVVSTPVPGTYYLHVWATDRAGNTHRVRVTGTLIVPPTTPAIPVVFEKDTTIGATIHEVGCPNASDAEKDTSCGLDCETGISAHIAENSTVTYTIQITGHSSMTQGAWGTFEDYLPLGMTPTGAPTASPAAVPNMLGSSRSAGITNISYVEETSGPNIGRWKVTGDWGVAPSAGQNDYVLSIICTVPAFDKAPGATNILSNQATFDWNEGDGVVATDSGTGASNYANHKVYGAPYIEKRTNWGGASHVDGCAKAGSLEVDGSCTSDCKAGEPGTLQLGDIVTYQLTFHNPSNVLQYFATDSAGNYDLLPPHFNTDGQAYRLEYTNAGGTTTTFSSSNLPATGGITMTPPVQADGTNVREINIVGNRVRQQGSSAISIAPGASVTLTVAARLTSGFDGDILANQVRAGYSPTGSNTATLRIGHAGVTEIRSNTVVHQIEEGTMLKKWAYSDTPAANTPTTHHMPCANAGNMLVTGGCISCTQGTANVQSGDVITYALTMDNANNSHRALNLNGIITDTGVAKPGMWVRATHLDADIPRGVIPEITTLRAYVTDKNGNNIPIDNVFFNSTPQTVNENGTNVTRQVLNLSSGLNNLYHSGTGDMIFQLTSVTLLSYSGQWVLNLENTHLHTNAQQSYSITYLFDAEVTGGHDEVIATNNFWMNRWEQHIGARVNNPERPTSAPITPQLGIIKSNTVVHARVSEGVKTAFTKVGADDITTGLAGAEFALYKWDGTNAPTSTEANHTVDTSVLIDTTTMPGGQWVRVKENAAIATLSDIFVSGSSPLGKVDLGKLPTGTYTLIETKSPNGYDLPVGQWILRITSTNGDTGAGDYKIEFAGKSQSIMPPAATRESAGTTHTYKIINIEPFSIGMSGLGGTSGMLIVGFVIMTLAGNTYIFLSRRRRKKR